LACQSISHELGDESVLRAHNQFSLRLLFGGDISVFLTLSERRTALLGNQFLVLVLIPILAAAIGNAVQCKVQGEVEIGRCAIAGCLAGVVTVIFFFVGLLLGGGK
jgi:hypothetical protein